jgi:hypothetical protein
MLLSGTSHYQSHSLPGEKYLIDLFSAVPNPKLSTEKIMIDAAIEAGVKRIVLSEFSSNLEAKAKDVNLPIVADKLEIRKYVEEATANSETEWSSINNGPFFDLGVKFVRSVALRSDESTLLIMQRDSSDPISVLKQQLITMVEKSLSQQLRRKTSAKP